MLGWHKVLLIARPARQLCEIRIPCPPIQHVLDPRQWVDPSSDYLIQLSKIGKYSYRVVFLWYHHRPPQERTTPISTKQSISVQKTSVCARAAEYGRE